MRVAATSDSIVEGNETYTLNAGIGAQTPVNGLGTISDATAALTVASVSAATGAEGTNLVHTVNLSGSNATGATTVSLSPANGSATIGSDTGTVQVSTDGGTTGTASRWARGTASASAYRPTARASSARRRDERQHC